MPNLADEHGVATVMVALIMPLLLLFAVLAVDVASWLVHKRHLQTQADAAALAGALSYRFPSCDDAAIRTATLRYSGTGAGAYNANFSTVPADRLHAVINEANYFGQSTPGDAELAAAPSPCTAKMIDVKMTESAVDEVFGTGIVPNINAQARVALFTVGSMTGLMPIGVEETAPKKARAYIVDEGTGATLASAPLTSAGSTGNVLKFSNAASALAFTPPDGVPNLGVRVVLSGAGSTTCGDPLVTCYDTGSTAGLAYLRSYKTTPDPLADEPPVARSVSIAPITCAGVQYNSSSACTVQVTATAKFNPAVTPANTVAKTALSVFFGGQTYPMTYSAATQSWTTTTAVTVPTGTVGTSSMDLQWTQTVGGIKNGNKIDDCTKNGKPCEGSIVGVQRTFWNNADDQASRGGPISTLLVRDADTNALVTDLQQNVARNLTFEIGVKGSLALSDPNEAPHPLRVSSDNGQTHSVDCDPNRGFVDEIAYGCGPTYSLNQGTTCTQGATNCVPVDTGGQTNKPAQGLNVRILCAPPGNPGNCGGSTGAWNGKPSTCPPAGQPGHNNWPNYPAGDPRIVPVLVVPFGSFESSGNGRIPVIDFAAFYVTGWSGSGGGFNNPCLGNGDQLAAGADNGVISGHFLKKILPNDGAAGTGTCDFTTLGQCVAVLVK